MLMQLAERDVKSRWKLYTQMAAMNFDGNGNGKSE
jgi:hypothetical protein